MVAASFCCIVRATKHEPYPPRAHAHNRTTQKWAEAYRVLSWRALWGLLLCWRVDGAGKPQSFSICSRDKQLCSRSAFSVRAALHYALPFRRQARTESLKLAEGCGIRHERAG